MPMPMKNLYPYLIFLIALNGCTHGQQNDHYYCNDRDSAEAYHDCMEAGEMIRSSPESRL